MSDGQVTYPFIREVWDSIECGRNPSPPVATPAPLPLRFALEVYRGRAVQVLTSLRGGGKSLALRNLSGRTDDDQADEEKPAKPDRRPSLGGNVETRRKRRKAQAKARQRKRK